MSQALMPLLQMQRKQIETSLSADIVEYLQKKGMTLKRIADMMKLSESFISRVANKKRGFTIEHLLRLESAVRKPLPMILLEVTSQRAVPEHLAPLYKKARAVLAAASDLEDTLRGPEAPREGRTRDTG